MWALSTSKIKSKASPYHHGDLRNTLLTSGAQLLAEEGIQALSLRSLAKRAGVSHNAPYQHFADKETFLAALAEQGFHLLGAAMDAGLQAVGEADTLACLIAIGQAYVQFALDYPSHLHIMFSSFPHERYPTLKQTSLEVLAKLIAVLEAGQAQQRLVPDDVYQQALLVWTMLHGLSTLSAAQKLPDPLISAQSPVALAEEAMKRLYQGIAKS